MQTQHMPVSGLMHAKPYDTKENAVRNALQPTSANIQTAIACRPASAPQSFGDESPYIEHTRRDSKGYNVSTKRYLKGALLGKGGFAKCYKIVDVETNKEWACKVVQKASLTKQRHKVKVRNPSSAVEGCPNCDTCTHSMHTHRTCRRQDGCSVALGGLLPMLTGPAEVSCERDLPLPFLHAAGLCERGRCLLRVDARQERACLTASTALHAPTASNGDQDPQVPETQACCSI
jgi:hypothetical protein